MPTSAPTPLASRILAVQSKVTALARESARVETSGGGAYTYQYISEEAMFEFLQGLLAEHGIVTLPVENATQWDGNRVTVHIGWLLIADDNPTDQYVVRMSAAAADRGDKALAKAQTSAVRYLLWKTFRFPQRDPGADPEATSVAHQSAELQEAINEHLRKAAEKGLEKEAADRIAAREASDQPVTIAFIRAEAGAVAAFQPPGGAETPPAGQPAPSPAPASGAAENGSQAAQTGDPAAIAGAALGQHGTPPAQLERLAALAGELAALDPERGTDPAVRLENITASCKAQYQGRGVEALTEQEAAAVIERVELAVATAKEKAAQA